MNEPNKSLPLKRANPCFTCAGPESPRKPGCHATCEQYNEWRLEKNLHNEHLLSIKLKNDILFKKSVYVQR